MADFHRDFTFVHARDDLAGDRLRFARQKRGGRRRFQLHSFVTDLPKFSFHSRELDDPGAAGLRGQPADDVDCRDNAFAVSLRQRGAQSLGRNRLVRCPIDGVVCAGAPDLPEKDSVVLEKIKPLNKAIRWGQELVDLIGRYSNLAVLNQLIEIT